MSGKSISVVFLLVCTLAFACSSESEPVTDGDGPADGDAESADGDVPVDGDAEAVDGDVPVDGDAEAVDGDEADPGPIAYSFEPVLFKSVSITSADRAGEDDVVSESETLAADEAYTFEIYEVPGMPCVRQDGGDLSTFPEGAELPGAPAVFGIAYPAATTRASGDRLMYFPHGNSNAALETGAIRAFQEYPSVYDMMVGMEPTMIEAYENQCTRYGAMVHMRTMAAEGLAVEMLRRGWTLVLPGNCWGDNGIGDSGVVDDYYRARRWGRVFDRETIAWTLSKTAIEQTPYAFGCSGGGARLSQLVLNEPDLFKAMIYDSPNDYVGSALSEPMPATADLINVMTDGLTLEVVQDYIENFYGSLEGCQDCSVGYRLGHDIRLDSIPILLGYVQEDPLLHPDAYKALAEALQDAERYDNPKSSVHEFEGDEHCPFKDTPDQWEFLLDWLDGV